MWQRVKPSENLNDDENEKQFCFDDLRQENNILRLELSTVYAQLTAQNTTVFKRESAYEQKETQTEDDAIGKLELSRIKLEDLEKEINYQKSLNLEQAKNAKEMERKIHSAEVKLLEYSLELLHSGPIKIKAEELAKSVSSLQSRLICVSDENLNLTIEIAHLQETIKRLIKQEQEEKESGLKQLNQVLQLKEQCTGNIYYDFSY